MYSLAHKTLLGVSPGFLQDFSDIYHDCSPGRFRGRAVVECRSSFCSSGRSGCRLRPSIADQGPERKFSCWPCRTTAISNWILYDTAAIFSQLVRAGYQALSRFYRYTLNLWGYLWINKPVFLLTWKMSIYSNVSDHRLLQLCNNFKYVWTGIYQLTEHWNTCLAKR